MQAATVAIIVRTIGHRHLTRAIASLLAQTHANLEIMLVVARPECDTKPSLLDPRVRVINTAVSLPRALAANRGLEATHADLIGFLDEDDWLAPAHVETLVAALTALPVQPASSPLETARPEPAFGTLMALAPTPAPSIRNPCRSILTPLAATRIPDLPETPVMFPVR